MFIKTINKLIIKYITYLLLKKRGEKRNDGCPKDEKNVFLHVKRKKPWPRLKVCITK